MTTITENEDLSILDTMLLNAVDRLGSLTVSDLNQVFGISDNVIFWRIRELEKQGFCIVDSDNHLILKEKGSERVKNPRYIAEKEAHYTFIIDGVDLTPLNKAYYSTGNQTALHTFLKEGETDYQPDHIHTPPDDRIIQNILRIDPEERKNYSIPQGLVDIIDYDPVLATHPIGVSLAVNANGDVLKEPIECCQSKVSTDLLSNMYRGNKEIFDSQVIGLQFNPRDQSYRFTSREASRDNQSVNSVFSLNRTDLIKKLADKFKIPYMVLEPDIDFSDRRIVWNISKAYFELDSGVPEKLISYLAKTRGYLLQRETDGVWIVFIQFCPKDEFVNDILAVHSVLRDQKQPIETLLEHFAYPYLRELVLAIGNYQELYNLDAYYYLSCYDNGRYVERYFKANI